MLADPVPDLASTSLVPKATLFPLHSSLQAVYDTPHHYHSYAQPLDGLFLPSACLPLPLCFVFRFKNELKPE